MLNKTLISTPACAGISPRPSRPETLLLFKTTLRCAASKDKSGEATMEPAPPSVNGPPASQLDLSRSESIPVKKRFDGLGEVWVLELAPSLRLARHSIRRPRSDLP